MKIKMTTAEAEKLIASDYPGASKPLTKTTKVRDPNSIEVWLTDPKPESIGHTRKFAGVPFYLRLAANAEDELPAYSFPAVFEFADNKKRCPDKGLIKALFDNGLIEGKYLDDQLVFLLTETGVSQFGSGQPSRTSLPENRLPQPLAAADTTERHMNTTLPEGKHIRIRSFYGFGPEEDGYVGWTQESARDAYLRKLQDGDLIMIYGASTPETEKSLRSYVLGFLEIEATPIRDYEKASEAGLNRKRDAGWADKWTYAIPVRRAWRAEEKVMISRIAFNSYRPEAGQALAVHGADLDDEEITQALKIKVREVSVFGENPLTEDESPVLPFAETFKPSKAFPGSFGERSATYEDGEAHLYLAVYDGDSHSLLGRKKDLGDKSVAMKIGVTNAPKRRCAELNAGIPPAASGKWAMSFTSQPFPNKKAAEDVEAQFKKNSSGRLESLGGEFFWGKLEDAQSLFWHLPGMSRF